MGFYTFEQEDQEIQFQGLNQALNMNKLEIIAETLSKACRNKLSAQ